MIVIYINANNDPKNITINIPCQPTKMPNIKTNFKSPPPMDSFFKRIDIILANPPKKRVPQRAPNIENTTSPKGFNNCKTIPNIIYM